MPRIKLYGFRPYLHYDENITQKLLKDFDFPDTEKIILDAEYFSEDVLNGLLSGKPDYIIGLGQCPKRLGKKLRLERKAVNWLRSEDGTYAQHIEDGPEELPVSLELPETDFSYEAFTEDKYVCNYSMYKVLNRIRKDDLKTKFAFIHVPEDYDIEKAREELREYLEELS